MSEYLESKNLKGKDIDVALAMSHVQSHHLVGGNFTDAFTHQPEDPRSLAIKKAIQAVDLNLLSGKTPLQKAASFMHLVQADDLLEKLEQAIMHNNPLAQQEQLEKMAMRQIKVAGQKGGKAGNGGKTPEQEFYELTPEQRQTFLAYQSIQHLPGLNFTKVKIYDPDPEGNIERDVQVETINEAIAAASGSDFASHDFREKLLDLDFHRTDEFKPRTVKQSVMLGVDDSGSMSRKGKQGVVQAVLRFLQEKIDSGDIDLWVFVFETDIQSLEYVTDTEDYYKRVIKADWGNTEVNDVIQEAQKIIASGEIAGVKVPLESRPQLVILNDGQDTVDPGMKTIFPVHAITIDVDNPDLRSLCNLSGGSFKHFVTEQHEIQSKLNPYNSVASDGRPLFYKLQEMRQLQEKTIKKLSKSLK